MRLNAVVVWRTSSGPTSGKGWIASPRPARSAADASAAIGRVIRRTMKITTTESVRPIRPSQVSAGAFHPKSGGRSRLSRLSQSPPSSCMETMIDRHLASIASPTPLFAAIVVVVIIPPPTAPIIIVIISGAPPATPVIIVVPEDDAQLPVIAIADQISEATAKGERVMLVLVLLDHALVRKPIADAPLAGRLQDILMQRRRGFFEKPRDGGCAAEKLRTVDGADRETPLIGEDRQRRDLRKHQSKQQEGDHLASETLRPETFEPTNQTGVTSAVKL